MAKGFHHLLTVHECNVTKKYVINNKTKSLWDNTINLSNDNAKIIEFDDNISSTQSDILLKCVKSLENNDHIMTCSNVKCKNMIEIPSNINENKAGTFTTPSISLTSNHHHYPYIHI